jgi:uncharacterized protein YvpB
MENRFLDAFLNRFLITMIFSFFFLSCSDLVQDDQTLDENTEKSNVAQAVAAQPFYLYANQPCQNPCAFSTSVYENIDEVVYYAEQWKLGSSSDSSKGFQISYDFSTLGDRKIKAIAYDLSGKEIYSASAIVEIYDAQIDGQSLPSNPQQPNQPNQPNVMDDFPLDIPYFYQYQNQLSPSVTCQNTSIAMVLKHYGWRGIPDQITSEFGKNYAQSPAGLADVFNTLSSRSGLSKKIIPNTSGSIEGLKRELDQGHPVIIHGYFTRSGHVVVVVGYDQNGYWVNDPAGRWAQSFKGGYPNAYQEPSVGKKIYYKKSAFEAAVSTSDGYAYLPLWYHAIRNR